MVLTSDKTTPVADLFEAHLTVTDLERAIHFYVDSLGLHLAQVVANRRVAFFWIGAPGKAMLGLWEAVTMPLDMSSSHVAFRVALSDLHESLMRLEKAGILARDFHGEATWEPVVLGWMPAAAIYFRDPDDNLLEYIAMLPDLPRPELGVVGWHDWVTRR